MSTASQAWQPVPRQGQVLADKYRIERLLGRGGMGMVFLAENTITGKRVALKWLDASIHDELARARFQREARAACQVSHPHVVDVYDVSEHAGCPFLVMEYLRGQTLQQLLDQQGRVPAQQLIEWLLPAMAGVAAANSLGIVHRDLKPDNVFLCERADGTIHPKVLDFGIAKFCAGTDPGSATPLTASSSHERAHSLTRPGALVGSPCYMAIEQIDATALDARVDVYAFGVILYRAITGELPYGSTSLSKLITEIAAGKPRPPRQLQPDLDRQLEAIILRAMARESSARFASVDELRAALSSYLRSRARGRASTEEQAGLEHTFGEISGVRRAARENVGAPRLQSSLGLRGVAIVLALLGIGALAWSLALPPFVAPTPEGALPFSARAPEGALRPSTALAAKAAPPPARQRPEASQAAAVAAALDTLPSQARALEAPAEPSEPAPTRRAAESADNLHEPPLLQPAQAKPRRSRVPTRRRAVAPYEPALL